VSKNKRRPNPLKSITPALAKQLSTEATISTIVTAFISGKSAIKIRVKNDLPPEILTAALSAIRLEIDFGSHSTLVIPLSELPLAGAPPDAVVQRVKP
jgi:hypothetical protein